MRVYHFTSCKAALAILKSRRLRLSRIAKLNDPFEFLAAELSGKINRLALKKMKKDFDKNEGVICFSENWQNPVQWAHYAKSHRGVCLGFDVPEHLLGKMAYSEQRLPWPAEGPSKSYMSQLLRTKYQHWQYEEEWRLFAQLETRDLDGHHYVDFSEDVRLVQVITGEASRLGAKAIAVHIQEAAGSVDVFPARAAFRHYKVVRQNKIERWKNRPWPIELRDDE